MGWRILAATLPVALLAGCLNTFEEPAEPARPHFLRIVTLDVSPARVLSQDVVLNVSTTLDNRGGGESDPVRLLVKAYSEERGFLLTENESFVGIVAPDTSRVVPVHLSVPREGGVRIDVAVIEADLGTQRASVYARNLAGLEPEVLDTGLRVSGVDFLVQEITNDTGRARAQIQTDLYITNEGDAASEDLQVQVKARELQTSLVADVAWVGTGSIAPSETAIRSVNLTVPDEYNYVFEILTWRGQTVVARYEDYVRLAPTFTKPTNTELVTTNPNLGDFAPTTPTTGYPTWSGDMSGGGMSPTAPTPKVPGVEVALLALAVVGAALTLRRRP